MKVLIIILLVAFTYCARIEKNPGINQDSIMILRKEIARGQIIIDSLQAERKVLRDSLYKCVYSIQTFDDRFKLAKIRRYIDICEKRPANKSYFFGWIKRTMNN